MAKIIVRHGLPSDPIYREGVRSFPVRWIKRSTRPRPKPDPVPVDNSQGPENANER